MDHRNITTMSMTHEEMIAVIQAHRDGKRIERILKSDCSPHRIWEELEPGHCDWSFATFRYRVKPEPPKPREFYLIKQTNCSHGSAIYGQCGWHAYTPEESITREGTIRVREVLE